MKLKAKTKRCCANCQYCEERAYKHWNVSAADYLIDTYFCCVGQKNAPEIYDTRREVCEGFKRKKKGE